MFQELPKNQLKSKFITLTLVKKCFTDDGPVYDFISAKDIALEPTSDETSAKTLTVDMPSSDLNFDRITVTYTLALTEVNGD